MKNYNFFLSYCHDGREAAAELKACLTKRGYSVFTGSELMTHSDWREEICRSISHSDYFVPVITDGYVDSVSAQEELKIAYDCAEGRSKSIIPVVLTDDVPYEVECEISGYLWIRGALGEMGSVVKMINRRVSTEYRVENLYERLSEYRELNSPNKEAEAICELLILSRRFRPATPTRVWCREALSLYEGLSKYSGGYDDTSLQVARKILMHLDATEWIWLGTERTRPNRIFYTDPFFASFVIRMIYLDRVIRLECADILTHGDARNACPAEQYLEKQAPFEEAYYSFEPSSDLTEAERQFIKDTEAFLFSNAATVTSPAKKTDKAVTEDDEVLLSVARFMREGNKLFDVLHSQGMAGDFLKCLLTSYERLKKYCEIVGAGDVAAECSDRIIEIRNEMEDDSATATAQNEKAEEGIRSLLGFRPMSVGSYDVFISFKDEDTDLAEKIYRYCHKCMKTPFWSKKSLPELSRSEYENAIYAALRSSRHFVVVFSKLEYLEAFWIKEEMSVFHREKLEGRKEDSNFVIVVTDDVYKAIIDSQKMCLDPRYCGYQIIKMSEYEELLPYYIL